MKLKFTGISIGLCGLFKRKLVEDIDIGFGFLPDYAGSGYGYEAASVVMAYATDQLELTRITGLTTASNHNSIRLLERPGLRFERKILFRADGGGSLLSGTPNPELYLFQRFLPRFKFGSVDFMPV